MSVHDAFRKIAHRTSCVVGSPMSFIVAVLVVVIWAATGPVFGFSDTWQLVINTSTTIVTFLVVFMIQNTQNRDSKALHLKLDELIHAISQARNKLIDSEDMSDEELAALEREFHDLHSDPDLRTSTPGVGEVGAATSEIESPPRTRGRESARRAVAHGRRRGASVDPRT